MQRVVRSTLVGLLTFAGLTACGDKVTVTNPPTTTATVPVVRSVTVSPASATLNQGDKITLAASVNADAGITDRTVTWTSSNTAIASVDANGVVTAGTTAGTATVTAAAKADLTVKGAALITVNGGAPIGAPATVTISSINQTTAAGSVPANLSNVAGQIDVTLNVDPGSAKLAGVDLIMNCTGPGNSGTDTVIATQSLASSSVAAEAASAPVTLSFNTASFDANGVAAFRNGACTLKARARTTTGTTTSTVATQLTLNNTDVVIGTLTASTNKTNPVTGQLWSGGNGTVTVRAIPVFYTPSRALRNLTVTFAGRTATMVGSVGSGTLSGPQTVVFTDGNGATVTNDIDGITNAAATATFSAADTLGNTIVNTFVGAGVCGANNFCTQQSVLAGAPAAVATLRLDTQKPAPGTLVVSPNANQGTTNGFVSGNFRFAADSAAGFVGPNANTATATNPSCLGASGGANPVTCNFDNGGVDSVTVIFQSATSATGTFTTLSTGADLSETTASNSRFLRMITTDALGNADTSFAGAGNASAASRFGIDRTAPTVTQTAGPSNQATSQVLGGTGAYAFSISDALSGTAPLTLVAQVTQNAGVTSAGFPSSTAVPNNTTFSNTGAPASAVAASPATGCIIGRFNRNSGVANARVDALPVLDPAGTQIGTCSPVPYNAGAGIPANAAGVSGYVTTRVVPADQAGNTTTPITTQIVEDAANPTAGPIDAPTTLTGGSSATFPAAATDNLDVVAGMVALHYNTVGMILEYPQVGGPGAAFDNVLTTSGNVAPVVPVFIRNLGTAPGAGQPTTAVAANAPDSIYVSAIDEVGRVGSTNNVLLTNLTSFTQPSNTGSANPFATTFTGGFIVNASAGVVSDCPAAGCAGGAAAANPTSTVLTATAAGTSGTFTNPFANVQFWYQVGGAGPWFLAGTATSFTSRDTGPSGQRFWDYTLTWTPPKSTQPSIVTGNVNSLTGCPLNVTVRAIGITSSGDGLLSSNTQPITLTNP